jgi:hypothetical protein
MIALPRGPAAQQAFDATPCRQSIPERPGFQGWVIGGRSVLAIHKALTPAASLVANGRPAFAAILVATASALVYAENPPIVDSTSPPALSPTLVTAASDGPAATPAEAPPSSTTTSGGLETTLTPQQRADRLRKSLAEIASRLKTGDPRQRTQELQQQVLADLDELLKPPPSSPPPPSPPPPSSQDPSGSSSHGGGGGSGSGQPPQNSDGRSGSSGDAGQADSPSDRSRASTSTDEAGSGSAGTGQQQPSGGDGSESRSTDQQQAAGADGDNRDAAGDSEEGHRQRRQRNPLLKPRQLAVDVWGHLPEQLRQKLLNAFDDRVVPQYEREVQRFYEALAEPANEPIRIKPNTPAARKKPD